MKRILVILCLIGTFIPLHAQYTQAESVRALEGNLREGQRLLMIGNSNYTTGSLFTALGGALLATPYLVDRFREPAPQDVTPREDMLSTMLYIFGFGLTMTGVVTTLSGIPFTVAGNGVLDAVDYWKDLRYNDPGQRGFGIILDVAGFLKHAQLKTTAGWHFNKNLFLGGGVGCTLDFAARDGDSPTWIFLPVYADFRYSASNRFYSPYIGFEGGYDILDGRPYLDADLGLRIRLSTRRPKSLWVSANGEVGGSYMRAGLKMGWSF